MSNPNNWFKELNIIPPKSFGWYIVSYKVERRKPKVIWVYASNPDEAITKLEGHKGEAKISWMKGPYTEEKAKTNFISFIDRNKIQ